MTVQPVTAEQVKNAALKANVTAIPHHECACCNCMVYFIVEDGELFFDPCCGCTSGLGSMFSRTWQDAANWINMQTDQICRSRVMKDFGFDKTINK